MRHPEDFTGTFGVMNTGMSLVVILYTAMGFFGYLKYGSDIQSSITLNFVSQGALGEVIKGMFAVSIFLSYGLQLYVPVKIIWPWIKEKFSLTSKYPERQLIFMEWGLRTVFVFFTCKFISNNPRVNTYENQEYEVMSNTTVPHLYDGVDVST